MKMWSPVELKGADPEEICIYLSFSSHEEGQGDKAPVRKKVSSSFGFSVW